VQDAFEHASKGWQPYQRLAYILLIDNGRVYEDWGARSGELVVKQIEHQGILDPFDGGPRQDQMYRYILLIVGFRRLHTISMLGASKTLTHAHAVEMPTTPIPEQQQKQQESLDYGEKRSTEHASEKNTIRGIFRS
jgi:hypothetical protein